MYGKLLLVLPSGDEREFVLEKETVTLGRGTDNDIVLPSPTVSRHHARLNFSSRPILEDLGSTFSTTVSGQKATHRALSSKDVV